MVECCESWGPRTDHPQGSCTRHFSDGVRGPLIDPVVLAVQSSPGFQAVSFSRVSNDLVGCVACKRHKVGTEFSKKVINVFDLVFGGLFSKDSDPGYKAVPLRSDAGLDNDLSLLCCPSWNSENLISESCKLERAHFCGSTHQNHRLQKAVRSFSCQP